MKELSLNILDIAMNCVKAGASSVKIRLKEDARTLEITISDNGCGMDGELLKSVLSPFSTTRKTRDVGLGLPFFALAAEQTGGSLKINSRHEKSNPMFHGTRVKALFIKDSIDFTPLGDIVSTILTLIQGQPDIRWIFRHDTEEGTVELDTLFVKKELGDVPIYLPEVLDFLRRGLEDEYGEIEYSFY